jgi:hypothetical protein
VYAAPSADSAVARKGAVERGTGVTATFAARLLITDVTARRVFDPCQLKSRSDFVVASRDVVPKDPTAAREVNAAQKGKSIVCAFCCEFLMVTCSFYCVRTSAGKIGCCPNGKICRG